MFIVTKDKNEIYSLPVQEIDPQKADVFSTDLAVRIAKLLLEKPSYPAKLAKELNVHEQKIYYHIRKFHEAGILQLAKTESKKGATAKYYRLKKPAFVISFKEPEPTQRIIKSESSFIEPFVKNGELDAKIIVGSPDPHGPDKARSRDGYYGIDLGLFLGTFLNYVPDFNVKLDTEVREKDLEENLILIGGPIVNKITARVNDNLKIKFSKDKSWAVVSGVSGKSYPTDATGLIVLDDNPFNKKKKVLLVAGKRYSGTRAAIIGFLKYFKDIKKGNLYDNKVMAKVVEGVDLDSDGIIDDVEFRE